MTDEEDGWISNDDIMWDMVDKNKSDPLVGFLYRQIKNREEFVIKSVKEFHELCIENEKLRQHIQELDDQIRTQAEIIAELQRRNPE